MDQQADPNTNRNVAENVRNVTISRKVNKFLDITFDEGFIDAVTFVEDAGLPLFKSSASSRVEGLGYESFEPKAPQLRLALDQRLVDLHQQFLNAFREVHDTFEVVASNVAKLESVCTEAHQTLITHRQSSQGLVEAVALLRAEMDEVQKKQEHVQQFLQQYNLTPEEAAVLRSGEVNIKFLTVLDKVRDIHNSCRDLLALEHQQAAVEIMETMYLTQLAALERLSKHLIGTTSELMANDLPELTQFYVLGVKALEEKPPLWARLIQEIARTRKAVTLRKFFEVMSKGTKPLESLVQNDIVRFFGDVLAWVHQSIAEEDDLLSCFFPHATKHRRDPEDQLSSSEAESRQPKTAVVPTSQAFLRKDELLDQIFEGLCKHLKAKLDVALETNRKVALHSPNTVLLAHFRLDHIFSFYAETTADLLGPHAPLTTFMKNAKLEVMVVFFDLLKLSATRATQVRPITSDLSTTSEILSLLRLLKSMMESLEHSLVPSGNREAEFQPILSAVIDGLPILIAKTEFPDPIARSVFAVNVLTNVKFTLIGHPFTAAKQQKVQELLDANFSSFLDAAQARCLAQIGFSESICSTSCRTSEIQEALELFQSYIRNSTGSLLSIPFLEKLESVKLREDANKKIATQICTVYEGLLNRCEVEKQSKLLTVKQLRVLLELA